MGGKEVDAGREGVESESESTRKGKGEPGQTQSSNAAQAPLSLCHSTTPAAVLSSGDSQNLSFRPHWSLSIIVKLVI